jgi:uncharacterized delta-60 repeat protein
MKITTTFLSLFAIFISFGQTVSIDSSYVVNGINKLEIAAGSDDQSLLSAVQPDNKVLICGATYSQSLNNTYPFVSRYLPNGDLDSAFNSTGINIVSSLATCFPYSMVLQDDGKIVLAGQHYSQGNVRGIVIRFNENGSLDSTFNQIGYNDISYSSKDYYGRTVTIQGDKIILAGYIHKSNTNYDFFATRFLSNGIIDSTFGINGVVKKDFGGVDVCRGVTVQPDNKIILTGYEENSFSPNIIRLLENGSEDVPFSNELALNTQYVYAMPYQSLVQEDSKIINVGFSFDTLTGKINTYATRLLPTGEKDASFGVNGEFMINISGEDTYGVYSAFYGDDKLVIVGNSGDAATNKMKLFAIGLNSDGSVDSTFLNNGIYTDLISTDYELLNAVHSNDNGKIIATGYYDEGGNWNKPVIVQFKVNELAGNVVEDFKNDIRISLGPNPLGDEYLNIVNNSEHNLTYTIYNAMGEIIMEANEIDKQTNREIKLDLSKGIYFVKFYSSEKKVSKTISLIKQ